MGEALNNGWLQALQDMAEKADLTSLHGVPLDLEDSASAKLHFYVTLASGIETWQGNMFHWPFPEPKRPYVTLVCCELLLYDCMSKHGLDWLRIILSSNHVGLQSLPVWQRQDLGNGNGNGKF
jgi:hypothetical protein